MQHSAEKFFTVVPPSTRVFVHDATRTPWVEAGKPGLHHKLIRGDEAKGTFLGLLAFDALVSSGLHQHTGVATSTMLSGSLTDYWDTYREGVTGINLQGSTHDAICYAQCSMVSRLEAPVLYPQDFSLHALHHGSRHGAFANPAPEMMPTISVNVAQTRAVATAAAGVTRRMIFDYGRTALHGGADAADDHRHVSLSILPGTRIAPFHVSALTEFFVLAGQVAINDAQAGPACFVIVEPDTEVVMRSDFGCSLLAWADGPSRWCERSEASDLFGF